MATWTEPKTDWEQGDSFSYEDYNRIKNNLVYLNDLFNGLFPPPYKIDLGPDKGLPANDGTLRKQDYIYASEFNAFEDCIDHFERIGVVYTYGKRGYYRANGPFLTPVQLNRIERLTAMYSAYDVEVDSISINGPTIVYLEDEDLRKKSVLYTATILPYEARYSQVTWTSSNPNIARIDEDGNCTIMGYGTVTITATSKGKSDSIQLLVSPVVQSISVTGGTDPIEEGGTGHITIDVHPVGAQYRVEYTSDDPSVASVDPDGTIHGVGQGTTTIHVCVYQGDDLVAETSFPITITEHIIQPTSVYIDPAPFAVGVGDEITLELKVVPYDATITNVVWTISGVGKTIIQKPVMPTSFTYDGEEHDVLEGYDPEAPVIVLPVEKVSQTTTKPYRIVLRGVCVGNVVVTATVNNGDFTPTANGEVYIRATNLIVNTTDINITVGNTTPISVTIEPENRTHSVTYTSSDPEVAAVDANGVVTGVGNGTATITVSIDGITKTIPVTISTAVTGITLNHSTGDLYVGDTEQLVATVLPATASNPKVIWSSSDSTIATVSQEGLVTALKEGNVTITAMTEEGGYSATCDYEITEEFIAPTRVIITPHEFGTVLGQTTVLTATIEPEDATVTDIRWFIDNDNFEIVSFTKTKPYTCTVKGLVSGTTHVTVDVNKWKDITENIITDYEKGPYISTSPTGTQTANVSVNDNDVISISMLGQAIVAFIETNKLSVNDGHTYILHGELNYLSNSYIVISLCYWKNASHTSYDTVPCKSGGTSMNRFGTNRITANDVGKSFSVECVPDGSFDDCFLAVTTGGQLSVKVRVSIDKCISSESISGGVSDIATGECASSFPVRGLQVIPDTANIKVYERINLTTQLTPSYATDKSVSWSSDDTSLATVSNGTVTGVAEGTVTITATANDGGCTDSCSVTIDGILDPTWGILHVDPSAVDADEYKDVTWGFYNADGDGSHRTYTEFAKVISVNPIQIEAGATYRWTIEYTEATTTYSQNSMLIALTNESHMWDDLESSNIAPNGTGRYTSTVTAISTKTYNQLSFIGTNKPKGSYRITTKIKAILERIS